MRKANTSSVTEDGESARAEALKLALEHHLEEPKEHVERLLKEVFKWWARPPRANLQKLEGLIADKSHDAAGARADVRVPHRNDEAAEADPCGRHNHRPSRLLDRARLGRAPIESCVLDSLAPLQPASMARRTLVRLRTRSWVLLPWE